MFHTLQYDTACNPVAFGDKNACIVSREIRYETKFKR